MMTDQEFADWLRSLPREKSPEEVDRIELEHDLEVGPWVGNENVHHTYGESRQ